MHRLILCGVLALLALPSPEPGPNPGLVLTAEQRPRAQRKLSGKTRKVIRGGLDWLLTHQDPRGFWDADGFWKQDPTEDRSTGNGDPNNDVGVTALTLLALLAGGDCGEGTPERAALDKGLDWLAAKQDGKTGLYGEKIGHTWIYNHGIATLAAAEAIIVLGREDLRDGAQKALGLIERARNPYGAWRYNQPPTGENDTSVTAWMATAIVTCGEAGLTINSEVYPSVLNWILEVTSLETGRIGYDSPGSVSARIHKVNDDFPSDIGEPMTAAGLFCERMLELRNKDEDLLEKQLMLLTRKQPNWDPDAHTIDQYYWYYGTLALHQYGGKQWKTWQKSLLGALEDGQSSVRGAEAGSWAPIGAWGFAGGRVYSTAIAVLTLATPARYARVDD